MGDLIVKKVSVKKTKLKKQIEKPLAQGVVHPVREQPAKPASK